MVSDFLEAPSTASRQTAIGIVVPHAGYMYSGKVAGSVYAKVQLSTRCVILCPNHTGLGAPLSIMSSGAWRTPLGEMQIDSEMCAALMSADPMLEEDFKAHQSEHALEVQLPFLQHILGDDIRFVPITVGVADWEYLEALGTAIAEVIRAVDPSTLIIASSDMNHYESDAVTRIKDAKAIDQVLKRDARGLYDTVQREKISMCGYGPTTSMLIAANLLGAQKAEIVSYATSADESGDYDRVVGFAGMVIS
jgi:AmmeMemoRadiSam system protein B